MCLPCPPPDGSSLHLHFCTDTADTTDTTNTADTTVRTLSCGIDDVVELIRDETQINVYYATVPGELILACIIHAHVHVHVPVHVHVHTLYSNMYMYYTGAIVDNLLKLSNALICHAVVRGVSS